MRAVLPRHRARSHAALLRGMAGDARTRFGEIASAWDPLRPGEVAPDLGRGFLDCYALGLHVLWTYQEAWAEEGFLGTARLPASAARLLELIGYAPRPASAAGGLQHFRAKPGSRTTLPPGFKVGAAAEGDQPAAVYETLRAGDIDSALNEMLPFLPPAAEPPGTPGAIAAAVELFAPEISIPPPDDQSPAGLANQLDRRLAAGTGRALARRNADRARIKAMQLAELARDLAGAGGAEACPETFAMLCEQVCQAQALANQVPDGFGPVALSESQQLLSAQLARLVRRQPDAMTGLAEALQRRGGESDADWSRRLDQMTAFLDSLVAGLLQEARDQVVRLRGNRALTLLDRAASGDTAEADRGVAPVGTDSLYLLPDATGPVPATRTALLRPGDWLVLAEDVETVAASGARQRERLYREAVRIERVFDEIPPGGTEIMTRIVFQPALTRLYLLAETVVLGNIIEISHGRSVEELAPAVGPDHTIALAQSPLTWLRDPQAPSGLVPQAELTAADLPWRRADDLADTPPHEAVFAVETQADGSSRLRIGDGINGAAIPDPAPTAIRYRVGAGEAGNRKGEAVNSLLDADAAVASTFNPLPIGGGGDAEPPVRSRAMAASGIHGLRHAVSLSDMRSLALGFGGVRRARVVHDPVRARQHVTLIVDGERDAPFGDAELRALEAFILGRAPPGTSLTVVNRVTIPVRLRLRLSLSERADPLGAIRGIRLRLGVDRSKADESGITQPGLMQSETVDLGADLHLSAIYRAIADIDGVLSSSVELFHRASEEPARRDVIQMADRELPVWDDAVGPHEGVQILWR